MASLFSQGTNEWCVQLSEHADHIQIKKHYEEKSPKISNCRKHQHFLLEFNNTGQAKDTCKLIPIIF